MAAQYDVNLEKCALLKCLCGSAFAAGQAPVRSLALKIYVILGLGARNFETPSLKNISIESEMSKKLKIEDVC